MSDTATGRSAAEILTVARTIFAASHWTIGGLSSVTWEYGEEEEKAKGVMCSVGGLRYAAIAPMENALDGAWMVEHLSLAEKVPLESSDGYRAAILALAQTVGEPISLKKALDYADEETRTLALEEVVIDWNDGFDWGSEAERLEILAEEVLPSFDEAIRVLKEREVS